MKKFCFLNICLFFCFYNYAQQAYTLDSCITLALKHNVEIKNALLSVEMAKQTKNEAFTKYFPKITGTVLGFGVKMEGDLKTSLDITLDDYIVPSNTMTIEYSFFKKGYSTGISAIQPIFVGGQIYHGNKLANIGVKAEKLQLSLSENEIKRKVQEYFWQIVSLEEKLKTVNTLNAQLGKIYIDAEASVKAGIINNNDFLKVQLKQQELLSAKIKIENGIRMTKSALQQYTGIIERNFSIIYDTLSLPESPQNYFISPEEAVNKRIETKLLNCQKEAGQLQTKIEIGKHLPTLGVGTAISYSEMKDFHNKSGYFFGTVNIPISDWWGGAYAIKKQKLQEKINENNYQNGIELLRLQTEQAWNELNESYMQLQVSQLSIKQSQDYLRICSDCYASGTSSLSNLLEAQSMLQQKHDEFVDAFITYYQKRTIYLQYTGK